MKIFYSFLLFGFSAALVSAQPVSFQPKGIGGGGALFALSINPSNTNEYYVSCDMGELFHTTDFGNTYSQVHFRELIGGHNSKVCFTSTPGLLYSISYANDLSIPVKSTDNGVNWTPLTGNPDDSEETFSIFADYKNPSRILISYYGAIYYSTDGGASFTNIHTATDGGAGVVVGGVFFDGNNIYIGTNDGVLVSTNGGTNWSVANITGLPTNERIWSFAGAKAGGVTRFFCLTGDVNDIYVGLMGSDYYDFMRGVYSVDYGAGNWTTKMIGITQGDDFPMFVAMAENDINTVYLAGSNNSSEPDILKTTDAGNNWEQVFLTAGNANISTGWSGEGGDRGWGYGECPFGVAVAPNNANYVIFGDYGFVHKTSDGGTSWQQAYVNTGDQHPANANTPQNQSYKSIGLENTTCWQVHWSTASDLWACYSDIRGIRSTDGGSSWSFNYTGNSANTTYRVVQHPSNGTLFAATSNVHDIYQSTRLADAQLDATDANGKIIYSTDKGHTWQTLHTFQHPVFWIALDPKNPNRAYASVIHYNGGAGVGGVYRCDDLQNLASSTWTLLPDPPNTQKHPASIVVLNDGKMVCTYSGRRTTVFTASSGVFIYDPATNDWTDVSDPDMYYWTKDVVVDPNDPQQNTWYVGVFSGWGGAPNGLGGLYKTTNRGTSWKKLTGTTLDRVTSCTFNPNNPDEMYITTESQGLWMSSDINAAAPTFSLVDAYPFKQPERVFFNPYNNTEMWVTSFGNGMKMGTLSAVTGILTFSDPPTNTLPVYPNPTTGIIQFQNEGATEMTVFNLLGEKALTTPLKQGSQLIDLTFLPSGIYFISAGDKKSKVLLKKD